MLPIEQKTHSRIGASHSKRWINCPGSVQLLEQVPRSPSTKYAAEGTVAHKIAEHFIHNGLLWCCAKDHPLCGTVQEEGDFKIKITTDMIEGANLYAKTIFADMVANGLVPAHIFQDRVCLSHQAIKPYLHIEKQFCIKSIDEELFGTSDASVLVPNRKLVIYDYKYGAGIPVEVAENEQLMFYALGVAEEHGGLYALGVSEIELVIVQPRAPHQDGAVRRWSCSVPQLAEFAQKLVEAVRRIKKPIPTDKQFSAGKWCRFCDAKHICNEMREEVNRTAQMNFAPVPTAVQYPSAPPVVTELTPEQIGGLLNKISLVKDFIESLENRALQLAQSGTKVPGYKCVQKKGNRQWVDESMVESHYAPLYGDDIYVERKIKSPAQLEKIVGKDSVKGFVVIPDAGLTLVRESDKRQEYIPAQEQFTMYLDL